jgi:hypothetical protein
MTASFMPISDRVGEAAGLQFRIHDKDNYYSLRGRARA